MKSEPKFIKDFSKEAYSNERNNLARDIKETRKRHFEAKNSRTVAMESLGGSIMEKDSLVLEKIKSIDQLSSELSSIDSSLPKKIFNYLKYRNIKSQLAVATEDHDRAVELTEADRNEIERLKNEDELSPELKEAKQKLDDFYNKLKDEWQKSPYSREDLEKHFNEDHLASLSIDDYTTLLKRFPGEMVTHVTRQGVRDHTGMMFHSLGFGHFWNGFKDILKEGRQKNQITLSIENSEKDKAVGLLLKLDLIDTKEEAMKELDIFLDPNKQGDAPGRYADFSAIHFATEEVADAYYGSEKGNEIFFCYPSALIASSYYYKGELNANSNSQYNDQWVWAKEHQGININSGITFIPEGAMVDARNGSQYELDIDNRPVIDSTWSDTINDLLRNENFSSFANKAVDFLGKLVGVSLEDLMEDDYFSGNDRNMESKKRVDELVVELEALGVKDMETKKVIFDYHLLQTLTLESDQVIKDAAIRKRLEEEGLLFKKAIKTVSSKEYWEEYFKQNPKQKPSKIVYYEGSDPTEALRSWKRDNDIKNKRISGFDDKEVKLSDTHEQAMSGSHRFRTIAEDVINRYYSNK